MRVVLGPRIKAVTEQRGDTLSYPHNITDPAKVREIRAIVQRVLAADNPGDIEFPSFMSLTHRTSRAFEVHFSLKPPRSLSCQRVTHDIWEIDLV